VALKQTKEMYVLNPLIKAITDNPDITLTLIDYSKAETEKLADEMVAKKIKAQ